MTNEERQSLKEKIVSEITIVRKSVVDLGEEAKPISPENAIGRISRIDAINNKSINEAALQKAKTKLSNLEIALNKIDTPGFGICSRCKQPIQTARLLYMPESTRCIHCADK